MPTTMTARERVLAALSHKEPAGVPIDLGGTQVSTLTRLAYHNLRAYLGMEPDRDPGICEPTMDVVYLNEDLAERYELDFRTVTLRGPDGFEPRRMPDDSFYDEYGVRWKKASYYYDPVERPLAGLSTTSELEQYPWPDPCDPGRVRGLREDARRLYEGTSYAIVADIMCSGPFEGGCILRGYEQFCADLALDPGFASALLGKITDIAIGLWDAFLGAVGDYVHVVAQGDDIGMQRGLYISPEMYRRFVKPCHRRIFEFIHSKTAAKVFLHSCGSVYDVIPDLIDVGVDILNPIQRSAAKMDIGRLKREFGNELCFWGGAIDVQRDLPFATLEQIEAEAKRAIEIMAPGGGYVFAASHNIQPDVSPDRIHKLYQTGLQHRKCLVRH